jgi:hypothetical protein
MQCQRVASPRNVLPSAEVPQELGAARLPHQGEVIEPQLLEAPPESAAILYFSCDEQAPGTRRVAGKIYVAFFGIVEPRREHTNSKKASARPDIFATLPLHSDRPDRKSLAILCGEAVGQLWRSVAMKKLRLLTRILDRAMYAIVQTMNGPARRFDGRILPPESHGQQPRYRSS